LTQNDPIEEAIAERRVFRKILQDLNWGDKADEEYAKIMELQTDLEENKWKKLATKFFFGWWVGWGVRILNRHPIKGGIVWSSVVLLIIYALVYAFGVFWNTCIHDFQFDNNYFRALNLIFTADARNLADVFVVATGFIQLNLFTVIIARKFMRM